MLEGIAGKVCGFVITDLFACSQLLPASCRFSWFPCVYDDFLVPPTKEYKYGLTLVPKEYKYSFSIIPIQKGDDPACIAREV